MVPDTDRRQFLCRTSLTLGGAALGAWLPVSLLEAAPAACLVDASGDWQLDDICIAYPPYSLHMKSPAPPAVATALADPADSHWVT
jgi:hypothetical protein